MAKSSFFPESILEKQGAIELNIDSIAKTFSQLYEQTHLFHWQVENYAEHVALGNLYDKLVDYKDDVVEKIIGYKGVRPKAFKLDILVDYTDEGCDKLVDDIIKFAEQLDGWAIKNFAPDISNISQSISGDAAKFKYLLTLS